MPHQQNPISSIYALEGGVQLSAQALHWAGPLWFWYEVSNLRHPNG